jgi:hypothetical protein
MDHPRVRLRIDSPSLLGSSETPSMTSNLLNKRTFGRTTSGVALYHRFTGFLVGY